MHEIKSASRRALINPLGAELHSLLCTQSGEEYIWEGDPAIWSGRAPILFPIVGGVREGRFCVDDQWYSMEKHGFARHQTFTLCEQQEHRAVFRLTSNEELLRLYPWRFELLVAFSLVAHTLSIDYTISNQDDHEMAFNIGSHPAFRLPLANAAIADYQIRFEQNETLQAYSVVNDLLDPEGRPYLQDEALIPLTAEIFAADALVFRNIKSSVISLEHLSQGPRIRVSTGGAPHLGIWAKPAAPFVCIEPWWGHADFSDSDGQLWHKASIQALAPGERFTTGISITALNPDDVG